MRYTATAERIKIECKARARASMRRALIMLIADKILVVVLK